MRDPLYQQLVVRVTGHDFGRETCIIAHMTFSFGYNTERVNWYSYTIGIKMISILCRIRMLM